ncbi:MAG: DUF115 domain-containing protein, partial [Treponema sp.]|jgi:hypothetical protein|nr:DUF115 domain-containing protein [Treponema sp.]
LGFGLGYAAQALAELAPQRPIIIVEKNLCLLRKTLELRDLSSLLSRAGVAFIPGGSGEGISGILSFFEKNTVEKSAPSVMRNRTLINSDEQWYAAVENRIRSWAMRDDVNAATLKKFGRRWTRNLSRNMSAIRDLPGISRLAGLAADNPADDSTDNPLPVFLAAAGPGLDSIAPLLPEIHQRCIVVAVDTSLRFLLRNGVDPDFTLVVDPQFWNSRHLDRCTSPHTRLIVETAVYPPVLRLPFKGLYLCGSLYPLGNFIEQRVDPKGALGAGGSVATSAWDFSRILGARQIWIAGLDLAFPGLKTHFRGARFEEKAFAESGRLNPAETWLIHALRGGIPFYAPSISGGQVLTDRRLSLYATWFENRFRQFPAVRNYSLSSDGIAIAGFEPAETAEILALPERRAEINHKLEAAFSRIETEFFETEETRRRGERYENAVTALSSGLRQIQNACVKGRKTAEQALQRDTGPAGREKTLAALDEVNRCITGSEVKEIAGFLFPPEILAEMGKTGQSADADESGAFHAYLKSSIRLYRSLEESAELGIH